MHSRGAVGIRRRPARVVELVLCALAWVSCGAPPLPRVVETPPPAKAPRSLEIDWVVAKASPGVRLSNAEPEVTEPPRVKPAPLSDADARALFARLPALQAPPKKQGFVLRQGPTPPAATKRITTVFPEPAAERSAAAEARGQEEQRPLEVAHHLQNGGD